MEKRLKKKLRSDLKLENIKIDMSINKSSLGCYLILFLILSFISIYLIYKTIFYTNLSTFCISLLFLVCILKNLFRLGLIYFNKQGIQSVRLCDSKLNFFYPNYNIVYNIKDIDYVIVEDRNISIYFLNNTYKKVDSFFSNYLEFVDLFES